MARFEVLRRTQMSPQETWQRLTDWRRHGDFVPFTSVRLHTGSSPGEGVGSGFTARTSLGPLGFDDPMEVTFWQPPLPPADAGADHVDRPGMCRLLKQGRVITGWAVLTVTAVADGSAVSWLEDLSVRGFGPWLNLPVRLAGARTFGRVVDGLLADG